MTHDREQIIAAAKLCGYWNGQTIEMNDVGLERFYAIALEHGRQLEREECAKVCDRKPSRHLSDYEQGCEDTANNLAEAIRARGDTK